MGRILEGHYQNLPRTSIGYRLDVQRFGFEQWLKRPVFGWGPRTSKYLIEHSGRPELLHPVKRGVIWISHLHNTYLEILVAFGLCGAVILMAAVALLVDSVRHGRRAGCISPDLALFLYGSLGLLALWSIFNFRVLHTDERAYWLLLAGMLYTFRLHGYRQAIFQVGPRV